MNPKKVNVGIARVKENQYVIDVEVRDLFLDLQHGEEGLHHVMFAGVVDISRV